MKDGQGCPWLGHEPRAWGTQGQFSSVPKTACMSLGKSFRSGSTQVLSVRARCRWPDLLVSVGQGARSPCQLGFRTRRSGTVGQIPGMGRSQENGRSGSGERSRLYWVSRLKQGQVQLYRRLPVLPSILSSGSGPVSTDVCFANLLRHLPLPFHRIGNLGTYFRLCESHCCT